MIYLTSITIHHFHLLRQRCVAIGGAPYKGIHVLIKAIAVVRKQFPDVTLEIAGDLGQNIPRWKQSGYFKYLKFLIKN